MKKVILIIAAAILTISNAYAVRIEVIIYGKGGGSGNTSGGKIEICPQPSQDKCATIVINTYTQVIDEFDPSAMSFERDGARVTPIYWRQNSVLLLNDETGEFIEGEILSIQRFDNLNAVATPDALPSLEKASLTDGAVRLTREK